MRLSKCVLCRNRRYAYVFDQKNAGTQNPSAFFYCTCICTHRDKKTLRCGTHRMKKLCILLKGLSTAPSLSFPRVCIKVYVCVIYIYICMYICIDVCVYICIHIYGCIVSYVCMTCVYTYMHTKNRHTQGKSCILLESMSTVPFYASCKCVDIVCIHVCVYKWMVCTHVCMYVNMSTCMFEHVHVHECTGSCMYVREHVYMYV